MSDAVLGDVKILDAAGNLVRVIPAATFVGRAPKKIAHREGTGQLARPSAPQPTARKERIKGRRTWALNSF